MTRIARKPILIPKGVEVKIEAQNVLFKGQKGSLSYDVHNLLGIKFENGQLSLVIKDLALNQNTESEPVFLNTMMGTTAAHLRNAVTGVQQGHEKTLDFVGVGYKGQIKGKKVELNLGYSHEVSIEIPEGIKVEMPSPTQVVIKGVNKQSVGQLAAKIKAVRPVEPYKGKGVRYSNEQVILKEIKK